MVGRPDRVGARSPKRERCTEILRRSVAAGAGGRSIGPGERGDEIRGVRPQGMIAGIAAWGGGIRPVGRHSSDVATISKRRFLRLVVMVATLALTTAALLYWLLRSDPVGTAEGILNLRTLPRSAQHVACLDLSFTDLQVACYFEIDSTDFQLLLAGRTFKKMPGSGTTHHRAAWQVGRDFEISTYYYHRLRNTSHGGSVTIATDAGRQHVVVDMYIE